MPPARSESIDIAAGAPTRVRIVVPRGGIVAGHVYDERHHPVAGVDLRFDAVSSVVGSSAQTKTDESGAFVLDGAPAGPFTLRAQKDGFRMQLLSGLRVESKATLTQDVTLAVLDGGGGFEFVGIGATLGHSRDGITLGSVLPGEAADRAGLRQGDRIRRIDGEETDAMSVSDALQRLRGTVGTSVGVSVMRPSTGENIDLVVVRSLIVR